MKSKMEPKSEILKAGLRIVGALDTMHKNGMTKDETDLVLSIISKSKNSLEAKNALKTVLNAKTLNIMSEERK